MNPSSGKSCLSPAVKCFYDVALLDTENDGDIDIIDEDDKGRDGKLTWKPGKSSRRDFGSFSR